MATYPIDKINLMTTAINFVGITNPFLVAGILGTVGKETNFNPTSEYSYGKTSVKRLRQIFGSRLAPYTDAELEFIKKDNIKFYDIIYGGKYGNTNYEDGYKYRGRGFNGITYKDQYKKYGDALGIDLINNPDLLNNLDTASKSLAIYFRDNIEIGRKTGLLKKTQGVNSIEEIKDLDTGVRVAVQTNAGWKTNFQHPTIQEGYKRAINYATDLLSTISPVDVLTNIALAPIVPLVQLGKEINKKKQLRYGLIIGGSVLVLAGGIYAVKKFRK